MSMWYICHGDFKTNKIVAYITTRQRDYPIKSKTPDKHNQPETEIEIENNKFDELMQADDNLSSDVESESNDVCYGYSNFENNWRKKNK